MTESPESQESDGITGSGLNNVVFWPGLDPLLPAFFNVLTAFFNVLARFPAFRPACSGVPAVLDQQ